MKTESDVICKCGKPIRFIDYKGRKHPINIKPQNLFVAINEYQGKSTGDAGEIPIFATKWKILPCYTSHFATCPLADEFRRQ